MSTQESRVLFRIRPCPSSGRTTISNSVLDAALDRYNKQRENIWVICDADIPHYNLPKYHQWFMPRLRISPIGDPSKIKYITFNGERCSWKISDENYRLSDVPYDRNLKGEDQEILIDKVIQKEGCGIKAIHEYMKETNDELDVRMIIERLDEFLEDCNFISGFNFALIDGIETMESILDRFMRAIETTLKKAKDLEVGA